MKKEFEMKNHLITEQKILNENESIRIKEDYAQKYEQLEA